jgi:hypothetical protein
MERLDIEAGIVEVGSYFRSRIVQDNRVLATAHIPINDGGRPNRRRKACNTTRYNGK